MMLFLFIYIIHSLPSFFIASLLKALSSLAILNWLWQCSTYFSFLKSKTLVYILYIVCVLKYNSIYNHTMHVKWMTTLRQQISVIKLLVTGKYGGHCFFYRYKTLPCHLYVCVYIRPFCYFKYNGRNDRTCYHYTNIHLPPGTRTTK